MSRNVPTPPANINSQMLPMIAGGVILEGMGVAFDVATGKAVFQNIILGSASTPIGLALNNAQPGETVYIAVSGIWRVPRNGGGTIIVGSVVGDISGTGVLGDITTLVGGGNAGEGDPHIGYLLAQDAATNTVLVKPRSPINAMSNLLGSSIQIQQNGDIDFNQFGGGTINGLPSGPLGANIVALPGQFTSDTGDSNFSFNLRIPASLVVATGSNFKLKYNAGTGGTTAIIGAVIRRTLPGSTAWLDSTPITWGGVGNPTFAAGSSNVSDAIALTIDTAHDYYIIVALGSALGVTTPAIGNVQLNGNGGEQPGDQRATANTTTLNFTLQMPGIAQVITA